MQLKRKGPEDGVLVDDLSAVAGVIPNKRLRPDWESPLYPIQEDIPITEVCPVEIPNDTPVQDSSPVSLFVTEPDIDDRALVLYKPMDPPAFTRLNTGTFPQDYTDFRISDAVDWFSPSKSFKQDSALSHGKSVESNSLAVIPYVAPYAVFHNSEARSGSDSYGGRVIIEDITDQVHEEEEDAMAVEEATPAPMDEGEPEQMEVMDASPAAPQFQTPSWQRFGPQFTQVMWSN